MPTNHQPLVTEPARMTTHLPVAIIPALQQPTATTSAATSSQGAQTAQRPLNTNGGLGAAPHDQRPPNAASSAAALQGGQGSPGSLYSAGGLSSGAQIIFDRQDVASARAERIEFALEHS